MPKLFDKIITKILVNRTSIIHAHSLCRKSLSIIQITMKIILWASFVKSKKWTFVEAYTIRPKIRTYLFWQLSNQLLRVELVMLSLLVIAELSRLGVMIGALKLLIKLVIHFIFINTSYSYQLAQFYYFTNL